MVVFGREPASSEMCGSVYEDSVYISTWERMLCLVLAKLSWILNLLASLSLISSSLQVQVCTVWLGICLFVLFLFLGGLLFLGCFPWNHDWLCYFVCLFLFLYMPSYIYFTFSMTGPTSSHHLLCCFFRKWNFNLKNQVQVLFIARWVCSVGGSWVWLHTSSTPPPPPQCPGGTGMGSLCEVSLVCVVRSQPGLCSEFQDSQGYIKRPCLKETNKYRCRARNTVHLGSLS